MIAYRHPTPFSASTMSGMIPVFIGIGYADSNETVWGQNFADFDKQLHFGRWK